MPNVGEAFINITTAAQRASERLEDIGRSVHAVTTAINTMQQEERTMPIGDYFQWDAPITVVNAAPIYDGARYTMSVWSTIGTFTNEPTVVPSLPQFEPVIPERNPQPWFGACGLGRCTCSTVYRDRNYTQPIVGLREQTGDRRQYEIIFSHDGTSELWVYYAASERMARAYHDFYWPDAKPISVRRSAPNRGMRPTRSQVDKMVEMRGFGEFVVDPERIY